MRFARAERRRRAIRPRQRRKRSSETALPRGGSLTGSTETIDLAVTRLTGAPLVARQPQHRRARAVARRVVDRVRRQPCLHGEAAPGPHVGRVAAALTAAEAATSLTSMTARDQPVGVRAIDPLTLEIRFGSPFAPGLRVLDQHPIAGFGPFVGDGRARLPAQPALLAQGGRTDRRFRIWMRWC